MEITINNSTDLKKAIDKAALALPARPTAPVLKGIKFHVEKNSNRAAADTLVISSYDYTTKSYAALDVNVKLSNDEEETEFLLVGDLTRRIISALPTGKPVTIKHGKDDKKIVVTCGSIEYNLSLMPLDEYPKEPAPPYTLTGRLKAEKFEQMVKRAKVAASADPTLPILTGISVTTSPDGILCESTDRYRLTRSYIPWDDPNDVPKDADYFGKYIISADVLDKTARFCAGREYVGIYAPKPNGDKNVVKFAGENRDQDENPKKDALYVSNGDVQTLLMDGNYPDISPLFFPAEKAEASAVVSRAELAEAVGRISIVLGTRDPLKLLFRGSTVTISGSNAEEGKGSEEIEGVEFNSTVEEISILFNHAYIKDALASFDTAKVKFLFQEQTGIKPTYIIGVDEDGVEDESYKHMIQPIRPSA